MKQFVIVMLAVMFAVSTVSYAQQPATGGKTVLGHNEECKDAAGCICKGTVVEVDVKKGCKCEISLGSPSQHCPVGQGGGIMPGSSVLWGLIGALIGSALTFFVMRRRGPPG